jgi:glyoxalase/bleomycin resistance protein/dioxygenase superfamily protein
MKRFHVHVAVKDLQESIKFYSSLFHAEPAVVKDDYAKWMLDDPRINFAISTRGETHGLNHLGIQVDSDEELEEMRGRLVRAETPMVEQREASCCYAKSNKQWTVDPQGIAWETFHTLASVPVFGEDRATKGKPVSIAEGVACCMPRAG